MDQVADLVLRAQRALHERSALACAAAAPAFGPDSFATWTQGSVLAVRVTVPALAFLNTLVIPADISLSDVQNALDDERWGKVPPQVIAAYEPGQAVLNHLQHSGYERTGERPLAIRELRLDESMDGAVGTGLTVVPVSTEQRDEAVAVLIDGYESGGDVARFIAAEHRDPRVRIWAVRDEGRTIAVAACSIHDDVVVIGGAATLRPARGRGAQAILLSVRLAAAVSAGCTAAVATASPGSPSLRNLVRAGFTVHMRPAFAVPRAVPG
jgi:hypothetical protein